MSEQHTEELERAMENTEPLMEAGQHLADAAISAVASDHGRCKERQIGRMGDRFAFEAVEMDPHQKQLVEYQVET